MKLHPVRLDEPLLPQLSGILEFCVTYPNATLEYDGCGSHSVSLVVEVNDPMPEENEL